MIETDMGTERDPLTTSIPCKNTSFLIILTLTAAIGGFLFGYDTGIIGGANLYIYDDLGYDTPLVEGTVVSLTVLGAIFGSIFSGPFSDQKGRKPTILMADVSFIIGAVIMGVSPNIWVLMLGRFVVGLGVGSAAMIVPVYLAESAPKDLRGTIVSINVLFVTLGQLIAYSVCLALGNRWRWMLGLAAVPAGLQFIGMLILPESPRFLFKIGNDEKALKVLLKIRINSKAGGIGHVEREVNEIKHAIQQEGNFPYISQLKMLFYNCKKAAIVGIGLQVLQQLDGINTAMYYGPQIMAAAGFDSSGKAAIEASIPIAFANMIGTMISVTYIDKLGRRSVLLFTIPLMVLSLLGLGVCFTFISYFEADMSIQFLAALFLLIYILFFSIGMGTCPWIINSEIYPLYIRSAATSTSTTANWVANFAVSLTFATVISFRVGNILVWIFLAGFGVLSWFWVYILLPETKGKSLEEILCMFDTKEVTKNPHQLN